MSHDHHDIMAFCNPLKSTSSFYFNTGIEKGIKTLSYSIVTGVGIGIQVVNYICKNEPQFPKGRSVENNRSLSTLNHQMCENLNTIESCRCKCKQSENRMDQNLNINQSNMRNYLLCPCDGSDRLRVCETHDRILFWELGKKMPENIMLDEIGVYLGVPDEIIISYKEKYQNENPMFRMLYHFWYK